MSSSVGSSRIATRLSGLVGIDLVWRVPAVTPGSDAGADLAVAVLSLGTTVSDAGQLELLSTSVLFAYVAATLAHRAYPDRLGLPVNAIGFRVLFALVTVAAAFVFRTLTDVSFPVAAVGLFVTAISGGTIFLAYLGWNCGWTLSPTDERFVTLVGGMYPASSLEEELRADFARSGLLGVVGATVGRAAAGTIVVLPAMFSGIVVSIL